MKRLNPRQMWEATLGSLELQVSRPSYTTWLKDTVGLSLDDNKMVVGAPSSFVSQWLEQRMSSLIEASLSQVSGQAMTVQFQVMAQSASNTPQREQPLRSSGLARQAANGHSRGNEDRSFKLNPRYTLDSFVVGESNQLAYAAALAVSSRPGSAYNPLFLYGGVGLGKTHLLHGIGHASASRGLSYLYVSSEQFTNEFITSIQMKRTREFREKYRSVDVLLIDDIQFMRGKEAIQESFFHTFNDLHNSNHQIVITCDRPSSSLVPLEDRLRSRFQWGLSADIRLPDLETRKAILEVKASSMGLGVPDEVLDLISEHFPSSIRDLEGALNRVCAYADLTDQPLDLGLAYDSLGDLLAAEQQHHPSPDLIIAKVCFFYGVEPSAVLSKRRDKKVTHARQVAIYLLRECSHMSLKDIGSYVGNRDHTTIRHAWAKILQAKTIDRDLLSQLESISGTLSGEPPY
ncbi:MAG: chromosomal replication initiator protein DnaA [Candidatus Bathyarchaeota archaeon]|nr:chromosomal replication initiator protein DnaA [Candidatus Bathyarchaeota archaeon]